MPRNLTAVLTIMALAVVGIIIAKRIPGVSGLL